MARASLKNVMRLLDTENDGLEPEKEFLADLKRNIEIIAKEESRKPSQTYKPSSMNCTRQMVYQVLGKEPDETGMSYTGIGIVNSGSDIHIRIQDYIARMKEHGMDCSYIDVGDFILTRNLKDITVREKVGAETKLYHEKLNMSFMCDGIIKYKNRYYILELKTEISNKFWSRMGVDPSHYNQAIAYSTAIGLDEVIFVYISRDTLDMKAYLFKVTDDMKQDLIGKIDYCESYAKQLLIPPKPADVDRKICQYCGYKTLCGRDK